MLFTEIKLKGAYIIEHKLIEDERGFFSRSFCRNEFKELGLNDHVAQCNTSFNYKKGTLRGLHMQIAPHGEVKLVRCISGSFFDVIVDLRPDSSTYCQWFGIELSAENNKMLYVPENFAHGLITLTDNTKTFYQVSEFYHPESERGLRWNDPAFSIEWPVAVNVISEKDQSHPLFNTDRGIE